MLGPGLPPERVGKKITPLTPQKCVFFCQPVLPVLLPARLGGRGGLGIDLWECFKHPDHRCSKTYVWEEPDSASIVPAIAFGATSSTPAPQR